MNITVWNVRTFIDRDDTDRPHRHTTLIASELARYKIDIATLSETRLAGKGEPTEKSSGYSFFWSGRIPYDIHKAGVGYTLKTLLVGKLAYPPKRMNDHLMTIRLPLHHGKRFASIISAYAPTMTNTDETKGKFYEDFEYVISAVLTAEKIIILGDFKAKVGQDHASWEGIQGKHRTGKCNGLLLLQTSTKHNLLINTIFCLPTCNKISWMHPRSKHWHLIHYIIVRWRDSHEGHVWCRMLDRSSPNYF